MVCSVIGEYSLMAATVDLLGLLSNPAKIAQLINLGTHKVFYPPKWIYGLIRLETAHLPMRRYILAL